MRDRTSKHGRAGGILQLSSCRHWLLALGIAVPILLSGCTDGGFAAPSYSPGGHNYDPWEQEWMDFKCEKVSTSSDPCPTGYRLPTLEEWLALLGGCEESYWGGSWDCNNCYQSSTCSALLGITEDTRFDWEEESDVATGTVIDGDRYLVDLEYGDVRRSEKSSACAYCVRDSS